MRSTLSVAACALVSLSPLLAFADKDRIDVGDEAPNFTAKTLNPDSARAKIFSLDSVVGPEATEKKKAVLVSFGQSSCEQCLKEMPFLEALYTEYREKGLLVVSVVTDTEDQDARKMSDAATTAKVDFPVLGDRFNIVAKRYFTTRPPSLFIIDENGRISRASIGYDESANAEIISEVRKNLGLSVSDPVPATLASFVRTGKSSEPTPAITQVAPTTDTPVTDIVPIKKGKAKKEKLAKPKKIKAAPAEPKGPKRVGRKPAP